jgi:F-type H+-transporting ATPase subunit gamma
MGMVAASKLKRAEAQLYAARPYATKLDMLLSHLAANVIDYTHPLFEKREVKTVALAVVTADKGMCGAYNTNIIRQAEIFLKNYPPNQDKQVKLILIGKRGIVYSHRRHWEILNVYPDFGGKLNNEKIAEIAEQMIALFLSHQVDEVYLLYTKFVSAMTFRPYLTKLLNIESSEIGTPLAAPEQSGVDDLNLPKENYSYIFEPSAQHIFSLLLPRYIKMKIYVSLAEAFTSEYAARMIAMRNATDNAEDMITRLTLLRNKLRQASITKEIAEIVGGSEALKG